MLNSIQESIIKNKWKILYFEILDFISNIKHLFQHFSATIKDQDLDSEFVNF